MARRRKHRRNPIASITRPLGVLTQNYTLETAKMGGAILGGIVGTATISDLAIKYGTSRLVSGDNLIAKIANFLTTGLVAGLTASLGARIAPARRNELLAGGMLVAASRIIPAAWMGGFSVNPPKLLGDDLLEGWSDDLGLETMNLNDYADPRRSASPMMAEFVQAGPMAPINRPMLADYSAFNQAQGAMNIAGMEDLVAEEII